MSLEKLMTKGKEIEVEINGEKVKLEVRKPNAFVWEKIRKFTNVELAKIKSDKSFKEKIEAEVSAMSDEDVVEELAGIQSAVDYLKIAVRLQEEKYKDLDTQMEVLKDEKASEEAKKQANEYIEKYQKELEKEMRKLTEGVKASLKQRSIESLRKELIKERIRVEAESEAYSRARFYQLGETVYYEGKKLSSYEDFEQLMESLDDSVLQTILTTMDELTLGGLDLKKSLSLMSS